MEWVALGGFSDRVEDGGHERCGLTGRKKRGSMASLLRWVVLGMGVVIGDVLRINDALLLSVD